MSTMYIVRGLPGSGKTTLARELVGSTNFFEADQFFNREGWYNFDPTKLKAAHEDCFNRVIDAMTRGCAVAVSNTFTMKWEYEKYVEAAKQNGYTVCVIHCESQFACIHNVPAETVERMKERWEPHVNEAPVSNVWGIEDNCFGD